MKPDERLFIPSIWAEDFRRYLDEAVKKMVEEAARINREAQLPR